MKINTHKAKWRGFWLLFSSLRYGVWC